MILNVVDDEIRGGEQFDVARHPNLGGPKDTYYTLHLDLGFGPRAQLASVKATHLIHGPQSGQPFEFFDNF